MERAKMWRPRLLSSLVLYLACCASFLPGFLSADPRNAYSTDDSTFSDFDGIVSYEFSPLHARNKRQVPISLKPTILNNTKPVSTIWANATQKLGSTSGDGGNDSSTLLRNGATVFINQNDTQVSLGNETAYPNGTSGEQQLPEFPENYEQVVKDHNLTRTDDDLVYYKVTYLPPSEGGSNYWVDLDQSNATKHDMLSNSHRRAATIIPKFDFIFYGHIIKNFTVATGGFIYVGEQVHAWLAATQYISPLMANFDSSNSPNSTVSFLSANKSFTVEWRNLRLHDSPDPGNYFTFQVTLHANGTIVFAYKGIPIPIKNINDTQHPVKVGLSDAYIRDRSLLVIKQKTIYEYHRVDLKDSKIVNGSAIVFTLQNTCLNFTTCEDCTSAKLKKFECGWCPRIGKCSSGIDRYRQRWLLNSCDKEGVVVNRTEECPILTFNYTTPSSSHREDTDDNTFSRTGNSHERLRPQEPPQVQKSRTSESGGTSAGGVIAIMFFVIILFASVGWVTYAYFYPHTPSGQFLIRYRPTQWGFRRGEARYTAASIHM